MMRSKFFMDNEYYELDIPCQSREFNSILFDRTDQVTLNSKNNRFIVFITSVQILLGTDRLGWRILVL